MGFYSFYRIIKDIIRTIFGNRAFRLILIACICGFLLCFVSDKVQATFEGDTHGIFDETIAIEQNASSFDLGDGNSEINVKLPSFIWNYDNIFVAYSYETTGNTTNNCRIVFSSSNLYFNFTNNLVYYDGNSSSYYYWSSVAIQNGVADFSDKQLSNFNLGVGSSGFFNPSFTFAGNYENYTALYGKIYQKNTNALILDSSSISSPVSSSIPVDFADARNNFSITLGGQTITLPAFVFSYKYLIVTHRVSNEWGVYFSDNLLCYANNTSSNNNNVPFHYILGTRDYLENGANNNSELNKFYYLNSNDANLANPNLSTYKLSDFTVVTTALYDAQTSPELNNNYYTATFDIFTVGGDILYEGDGSFLSNQPYFEPSDSEIQSLNWSNIYVELGDFNINENDLYIHRLEVSRTVVGTGAQEPISYYYNDNIILLKKGDKYWKKLGDTNNYYFSVPISQFAFKPEKAYFLVLTDNPGIINNSLGVIDKGYYANIFQIVEINSSNLITIDDVINNNIEKMGDDVTFLGRTIEESLSIGSENNKQLTEETNDVIDTNINFNNNNSGLDNVRNGFFSRLTSTLTNIFDYDISQVDTIVFPIKDKNIEIRSDMISAYIPSTLSNIIQAMWFFIFNFYLFKFVNDIYHSFKTGNILNGFNSKNEVITNDML